MCKTRHLAGIVPPKIKIVSIHSPSYIRNLYDLFSSAKHIILKNVGKETILVTSEQNKKGKISQNIFFYVTQKESHKGLKRHKCKNVMTEFEILGELCL